MVVICWKRQKSQSTSGPSRATPGPGKTLSRGPIPPPPFCMSWDRDAEGIERKEAWGEVSPHHPTSGLGQRRKLPQWGPGRNPGLKWILCRKKPSGTPFSAFLSDGGAPQTSRGLGKLSSLPPLSIDGPGQHCQDPKHTILCLVTRNKSVGLDDGWNNMLLPSSYHIATGILLYDADIWSVSKIKTKGLPETSSLSKQLAKKTFCISWS